MGQLPQRPNMVTMFLRTRLHMYLLWSTCAFIVLAIISGLLTDGGSNSGESATKTTSVSTTVPKSTTTLTPTEYVVQPGESLFAIAKKFNLSAPALVELNKIKNPDRVPAGTTLLLPPSNGFVPIGATSTMPP